MTVGKYADMPLQDPADTLRHGGIFLLRTPPHSNAAISLDAWTTQVKIGTKAVVTFGPGRSTDGAGAFSEALAAANNGLDYMSARGFANVAIRNDQDDSIVWWPEGQGSVARATVVWPTRIGFSAEGVVRDSAGNVIPSPPLNPVQHNAFRFIRMSRTSAYLYDSYRNMFLALESLLADIAPPQPGEREAAWFKRALAETGNLTPPVSVAELAPAGEADPITWVYENIYRDERSGLMHAKRNYLLPLDETVRQGLAASLASMSNYVDKLVAAHLRVTRLGGGMSDVGRRMLNENFLTSHRLFLSDDTSLVHEDDETAAPAPDSIVLDASPSNFTMVDEWYGRVEACWDSSQLAPLDTVGRMGAMTANGDPGGVASDLVGPLQLGTSVTRFEIHFGVRMFDAAAPPRHFRA